ncbi:MAG: amino acid permease [candidate division SR1 bacterium]|nr:MAG: amino acid permease [candidate division SR1 bacterium]
MQGKEYSIFTALAMIIGTVIGSGIFFKADNILEYTHGNVFLGVIIFVLAAFAIIFGSLSIAQLAMRTDKPGGLITYADEFVSRRAAGMMGWFQIFLYYPTLAVIVSWVVGVYVALLFGVQDASLELQIGIGFGWLLVTYVMNMLSGRLGGKFQEFTTIVKLIPLFVLGIGAFIFGDPVGVFTAHPGGLIHTGGSSFGWLLAVGPIAYAFDGWVISTSIAHKIRNARRNLPLALSIAPLGILLIYLVYLVGISSYLGPERVMELGDTSVDLVAQGLFGETIAKAFLVFVVVSVMGTLNGLILGFIHLPYSLAIRGLIPFKEKLSLVHKKYNMPLVSAVFSFVVVLFWMGIHYVVMKYDLLMGMDISEISIVVSYLLYVMFYYQVFRLWRKGVVKNIFFGCIAPILATLGSVFILFGGVQNIVFLTVCLPICFVVLFLAYRYTKSYKKD